MPHGYYDAMMREALPGQQVIEQRGLIEHNPHKRHSPGEYNDFIPNKTARTHLPPQSPPGIPLRPRFQQRHPVHHARGGYRHQSPRALHAQTFQRHAAPRIQPEGVLTIAGQHQQQQPSSNYVNETKHFVRSYGPSSRYQICLLIPSDVHPQVNWAGRLIGQKGATIKHLRNTYSVNVFINVPNAPPNDNSYDPNIHPDHVKICAVGGTLADCMNRVTNCIAEIEERFEPAWKDPNLQPKEDDQYTQDQDDSS